MKQAIFTEDAPQAIGPYSQAIKVGDIVYLSGQLGVEPKTGNLVAGGAAEEAAQMLKNITAVASAAGGSLSAVVKMTLYLIDMDDFSDVNQVMAAHWPQPYPARVCVAVKTLPKGASVEADAIMVLNESR